MLGNSVLGNLVVGNLVVGNLVVEISSLALSGKCFFDDR